MTPLKWPGWIADSSAESCDMKLTLTSDLRVEEVDGDVIVLDRAGALVHKVSGDSVEVIRLIAGGIDQADLPAGLEPALSSLVEAGVVAKPAGWSRRKLLLAGGVGLASAGVATFALASPAAAASVSCTGTSLPTALTAADTTFTPGPGVTMVRLNAWGGGGSAGARSDASKRTAGGGGGAYASLTLGVTPCATYDLSVTVGSGGSDPGTSTNGFGNSGGTSQVQVTPTLAGTLKDSAGTTVSSALAVAPGGGGGGGEYDAKKGTYKGENPGGLGASGATARVNYGSGLETPSANAWVANGGAGAEQGDNGVKIGGAGGGAGGCNAVAINGNAAVVDVATGGSGRGSTSMSAGTFGYRGGNGGASGTPTSAPGVSGFPGGGAAGRGEPGKGGTEYSSTAGGNGYVYIENASPS